MTLRVDDRWLWLGLGVFFFAAAKGIAHGLREIVGLSELHKEDFAKSTTEADVEDSVPLTALETLVKSPNSDIANAATSLLLNRFASSATSQESWINELFSSNLKTRQQAEHILRLYANYRLPPEISTPDVVHLSGLLGLVTLTNSDEDGITKTIQSAYHVALRRRAHGNNDAWQALHDLSQRLEHEAAVSRRLGYSGARNGAGTAFIAAPWLEEWQIVYWVQAQQQILNVRDPEDIDLDLARETFWQRCEQADPNRIVSGRLVDLAEILDPDLRETENESSFTHELVDTGRPSLWGRVPRFNEESPEEAEVRRRRRDVMVLHEGGGPIGREDIIQPPSMLTDRYGRSLDGRAWTR